MTCRNYSSRLEVLEDYVTGALEGASQKEIRAHLAACPDCRGAVELVAGSGALLRAAYEPANSPKGAFWTRLRASLNEEEARLSQMGDFWGAFEQLAVRLSFGAAAVAVLLLGIVIGTHLPHASGEQPSPEARDIFPEPVRQPATGDEVLLELAAGRARMEEKR